MTAILPARRAEERLAPRRRWPDLFLLGLPLAVVVAVQGWNITGYPAFSDDEGTYLDQAWAVQHGHGLTPYTYWYDHPPGGWIQLAAVSWPPVLRYGTPALARERWIMLAVTAISAALVYALGRRLDMRRPMAALAVVLFGLSPLSVALQRQVYLDGIAVAWMLAAFVLALSWRRQLWQHLAAGACAAISVLSKETMVVVLPALVLALWQHGHPSTRRFSMAGFLTVLLFVSFLYPLYAALKGELLPGRGHVSLLSGIWFQLYGRPSSDTTSVLADWVSKDAILLSAGLVAVVVSLALTMRPAWRRLRPPALAAGLLIVVGLRPGGYLPAMYVVQLLPFLALAVAGVTEVLLLGRGWVRGTAGAVGVLAAVAAVALPWYRGDHRADTEQANTGYQAAARWLTSGGIPDPAHTTVVLDDVLWLDAVDAGLRPGPGAIWFEKVQAGNGVPTTVRDWQGVQYLISTLVVRQAAPTIPVVRAALDHSQVIETFGTGNTRIEIRKVTP